jgi:hypothetical protein
MAKNVYPLPGGKPGTQKAKKGSQSVANWARTLGKRAGFLGAIPSLSIPEEFSTKNIAGRSTESVISDLYNNAFDIAQEQLNQGSMPVDGSGAGGGGGLSAAERAKQRALNQYTRQIQRMLRSGSYMEPYNDLTTTLGEQYDAARPQIQGAYNSLISQIQQQQNPYANITGQATAVTPQLQQLLEGQGVSTQPLQEFASTLQAQNQGQADAFTNLARAMSTIQQSGQQSAMNAAQAQQANLLSALENARLGYGAQIASQGQQRQQQLLETLLSAISQGGTPRRGRLF